MAILMLTACGDVGMAVDAIKAGALHFVLKSLRLEHVEAAVRDANRRNPGRRIEIHRMKELEETVQRQSGEIRSVAGQRKETSASTLRAPVAVLHAREHETRSHSPGAGNYAISLGRLPDATRFGQLFESAREEIASGRGIQFDPSVVDLFLAIPPRIWSEIRKSSLSEQAVASTNLPRLVM